MFSFKEFQKYEINNVLTKYVNKIHEYYEYFFQNRDKKRYLVALKCKRTINTEFGIGIFNQRVYLDKINKKYYYPIYEKFNINKRAKMINDLKQEIISYLGKKKHYQDIQDILKTFINNKEGIRNQNTSWNIGCSAESDIQHLIKSQTKGAKIYNYKTLNNMLIAKVNYFNNRI